MSEEPKPRVARVLIANADLLDVAAAITTNVQRPLVEAASWDKAVGHKPKPVKAACSFCSGRATKACDTPSCRAVMCGRHTTVEGLKEVCCNCRQQYGGDGLTEKAAGEYE